MEWFSAIGGWKTILGAGLSIVAALFTIYLKNKEIFPFKPRTKKVLDESEKYNEKIDDALNEGKYADYLNSSDDVLDERERLQQIEESNKKGGQ